MRFCIRTKYIVKLKLCQQLENVLIGYGIMT